MRANFSRRLRAQKRKNEEENLQETKKFISPVKDCFSNSFHKLLINDHNHRRQRQVAPSSSIRKNGNVLRGEFII
jgi:hypothetical protein